MKPKMASTVTDVLAHHIAALSNGDLEDVLLDYTDETVIMAQEQTIRGLTDIRAYIQALLAGTPPEMMAALTPLRQDIQGEIAYIVWKAEPFVRLGSDTFVIRDGKILAQTFVTVV